MAVETRHCDRCERTFEVDVSGGGRGGQVEGCPEDAADCGLANPGEHVRVLREIDST
jgi:hypothetical protein